MTIDSLSPVLLGVIGLVVVLALLAALITTRYKVAGPNEAFIVTGRGGRVASSLRAPLLPRAAPGRPLDADRRGHHHRLQVVQRRPDSLVSHRSTPPSTRPPGSSVRTLATGAPSRTRPSPAGDADRQPRGSSFDTTCRAR